ncbi:hypothetical protein JZ751_017292 [Albula glossodonta]|uniref:WD repeat-containing protein 76 n=1 Tax=Albula glossodonta TaxID=121402 RepID=A0A8T2N5A6_9TELE|nr:hypothetical protein JZ751_017292 [Albula glossodonta]
MPAATEENMTDETTPPRAEEAAVPVRRSSRQASKKRVVLSPNEVKQKRLRYTEDKAGDPQKLKKPPLEAATVKQSEIMLNNENCDSDAEQDCPAVSLLSDSEAEQDCPAVSLLSDSEAEQDYPAATAALKPKPKPKSRGLRKEKPRVSEEVLPVRKSLRLQKQEAQVLLLRENPPMADDAVEMMRKLEGPVAMVPVNMEEGSVLPTELLELWKEVRGAACVHDNHRRPFAPPLTDRLTVSVLQCTDTQREKRSLKEYRAELNRLQLSEERVVKVVKERIFSAAFHPCASRLLLAAGDKTGRVGLWDMGAQWGDDGVLLFEPHSRPVCSMAFSRTSPSSLLTLSYDGCLRCTDVERAIFDEVYRSDVGLSSFDFLSHDCSTLLVCNWEGEVAVVDRRTPGTSHECVSSLDPRTLRCVSVHPLQRQYFVAAESSISSAYFSPDSGTRVLTTCMDNRIRVFDTSELKPQVPLLSSIRHNMHTGRWLTKLRAVWDPRQEDCFVVGSVERPRQVQVYHESGEQLRVLEDAELLTTVCSVTAFHPSRAALLGGNASGRLHVFTP